MRIALNLSLDLPNRNTQQHSYRGNSQQKYHIQMYMDAVYHMNDVWMVSVIRMRYASYMASIAIEAIHSLDIASYS